MKKAFLKIFHVFLAVVVLISSTGFGLVEHSCTMRGKTTSLHKNDGSCCNKKTSQNPLNQTSLKKSACCSESQKYENVEYSSSVSQLIAKFTQKVVDTIKAFVFDIAKTMVETITDVFYNFLQKSSSLALSGQEIRVLNQSFTI